jgi:hypothetical protein
VVHEKPLSTRTAERFWGAAVLGVEGGEVVSQLQLAMMGGVTARTSRGRDLRAPAAGRVSQQPVRGRSITKPFRSRDDAYRTRPPDRHDRFGRPASRNACKGATEATASHAVLVAQLSDEDLHRQHDPLMSPILWDLGHIAAFEDLWLTRNLSGRIEFSEMPGLYNPFEHPRRVRAHLHFPSR